MRHSFLKLAGLLLVLTLALTGCNLIGVDQMKQLDLDFAALNKDFETVVAEYDGGTLTKGDVIGTFASNLNYYSQMYSMFGMSLTDEVVENVKQQTLETAVQDVAIAQEFEKRGLSLSEEKQKEVEEKIETNYQQVFDSLYKDAEGKGDAKTRQTEYNAAAAGFSRESITNMMMAEARREALEESVKAEVEEISDDRLKEIYDEHVASDEETYANDAGSFESAMTSEDEVVTWMPEGYRTVKHILVQPDDEALTTAVSDARSALNDLEEHLAEHQEELEALNTEEADADAEADEAADADAETDGEAEEDAKSAEDIQAEIDALQADVEAAQKTLADAQEALLAAVKDRTDEIYEKLAAGESFESLMEAYGQDPGMQNEPTATRGYYVSANSENWDKAFTDGAMALEKVGDVSETPVASGSGVHIIRYESDVTPGAVAYDEVAERLRTSALEEEKDAHYTETLNALTEALKPVYHADAFTIGE